MKGGIRTGAGRPHGSRDKSPRVESHRGKILHVRLTDEECGYVTRCAGVVGESLSEFVRGAISQRCAGQVTE